MPLPTVVLTLALGLQGSPAPLPRDSALILKAARASQSRFERLRRQYLPEYLGSSDPCDEHIGRYCFRYGDREELSEAPPDSAPVVRARDQLIYELTNAARAVPGDEWIAGQRVRYLAEARRPDAAVAAAGACLPPAGWWCLALLGFAHHAAGHFATADTVFARALDAMPRDERCRWSDLSPLLDRPPPEYRRAACDLQDSVATRFWWLADPLYSVPGNERRTEHYARWVMSRLQRTAASPAGDTWGDDQQQILIRFGWPSGWARHRFRPGGGEEVVSNYRSPQRAYEPPARFIRQPASIARGSWSLVPDRPLGGYVPGYAARVDTLASQVARFRRGDSAVVVAAFEFTADSVTAETEVRAAAVLSRGPAEAPAVSVRDPARARGVLVVPAPASGAILSLELLAAAERRAGRQRYWLPLEAPAAGQIGLSDLLLLSRSDDLPQSLEAAAPLARPHATIGPETVGLYWELYGGGPAVSPYAIAVTVVRESAGFLRRAARALGLAGDARPQVRLAWSALSDPGDVTPGALALDLSTARAGRYTIRVAVTARGDSAVTERSVIVRE